jgi:hypothetical protein
MWIVENFDVFLAALVPVACITILVILAIKSHFIEQLTELTADKKSCE